MFGQSHTQVRHLAFLGDQELVPLRLAAGVHGDKEDLQDPLVAHGQWDTEVAEGVEGHRHTATGRAHQGGPEEAVESVHDHRIVPPLVVLPGLLGHLLSGPPGSVGQLRGPLLLDAIQVLVQPVQEERQQLLRVMQLAAQELGREVADLGLEHVGRDGAVVAGPHLLHQVGVGLCNLPLHAQRVAEVELLQVAVLEEVLGELGHVAEALQGRVHEARVAQVGEPTEARLASEVLALLRGAARGRWLRPGPGGSVVSGLHDDHLLSLESGRQVL